MSTTPRTLLLFDVDLTLVNARGLGQVAMRTAGQRVCGEGFSFEGVRFGGRLDPLIFKDAVANHPDPGAVHKHDDFRVAYTRELQRLVDEDGNTIDALPGVLGLLGNLLDRVDQLGDVTLGLLTGNYAETAKIKIESAGLKRDWFTLGCFGDEAESRPALAALALKRFEEVTQSPPDPARVIIIGDTPHDVDCAKSNGLTAFAVATGRVSADTLRDAGADIVVDDLTNTDALYDLIQRQ